MLDILHEAQENDVAVSGLWIQDWSGKITTEFGTRFYKIVPKSVIQMLSHSFRINLSEPWMCMCSI